MACCATEKVNLSIPYHFRKYPCKIKEAKLCSYTRLEDFVYLQEPGGKEDQEEEKSQAPKRSPCENVKPPSKKKYLENKKKKICAANYSRSWDLNLSPCSPSNEFPTWFRRQRRTANAWPGKCPREEDSYEKNLWTPICKPPVTREKCREPIDEGTCVFCLGSLYTGGFIHDLLEKTPLIMKQSEIYGDDIAWRIGERTRIVVHKKCYDSYIKALVREKEEEGDVELENEKIEEDEEDLSCGKKEEEEGDKEKKVGEKEKKEEEKEKEEHKVESLLSNKKKLEGSEVAERDRKQYFCLKKFKLPKIDSGANAVSMGRFKAHGLVADLWPNIRLLQLSGHFLHEYHDDNSAMNVLMRKIYSCLHLVLILVHFAAIIANLAMEADDVNILAANSITVLFFTHCITKFCYFALRRQKFYRTLAVWDVQNSHPLFAESHARHRAVAITKSRRLLMITVIGTLLTVIGWTGSTFFGESSKVIPDPENNNETVKVEIPRLMLRAWYPWDASSGTNYMLSFVYQLYWLVFTLFHANLVDLLFCSWLIFACEQLLHVKEIMKPLIDLSSSLDTYNPSSSDLFKVSGTVSENVENFFDSKDERQINIRSIYSNMRDFSMNRNNVSNTISAVNGIGPNGLTKKHEMLVRSAIKYWVERHKHIVRYVGAIGDAYGLALLLHMLTSTITLTLLAYQATKIDGMDLYAMAVLGYLFYSLAQVFAFCIYGNQLIEESSSVMEAAYSCQWYDGSEEAKTFVQIVCQQCQKALSISGAKFFTVSLDLFASVLGAVVTYFMVLVQLK